MKTVYFYESPQIEVVEVFLQNTILTGSNQTGIHVGFLDNEEDDYNKEKLNLASLFWKQKEASLKSECSVLDKVFIDTFIN